MNFQLSQKFCCQKCQNRNQNQNKNNFPAPHSNEAETQTQHKLDLKHFDRDLHLMGLAHVAKNVEERWRECVRERERGREGNTEQKVSTAKGATDEQVKRKTIANYGSSPVYRYCQPLTTGDTLSQHKNGKQNTEQNKKPEGTRREKL